MLCTFFQLFNKVYVIRVILGNLVSYFLSFHNFANGDRNPQHVHLSVEENLVPDVGRHADFKR